MEEPRGLDRMDEKRPDGMTLIPWSEVKCLTWDITVADTQTPSYYNCLFSEANNKYIILFSIN